MNLKEYLFREDISQKDFAQKIGVSPKTLWSIMNGADLKLSVAMKIEKETDGKVKCQDLVKED